jgi:two-component system phosphate regulon sensor histidine kinase PhoR
VRGGLLLGAALAIGGVPTACLLALAIGGAARFNPTLLACLLSAASATALAVLWTTDVHRLSETLRRAARAESGPHPESLRRPRLPAVARVADGIERLARTLADRASQVESLLRANEAIVERLPDTLLVLGADGSVRRANAAARAAFGADMAAVVRHPVLHAAIEQAFARQGAPQSAELTLPVPVRRDVQATVLVLDPPLADGGHAIVVLSDRTTERAVDRMRADFVANASHELRTPLTSLIGFIDTLRGPAADDLPAQQRFLAIMAEQAQRMNRLIDDLLSLSRIEMTEHQAPSDLVDPGDVARRVTALFEPPGRADRASIVLQIEPKLPRVVADADQLEQVLQNLVENAVKYGRDGGQVRVDIATSRPGRRWPARPGVIMAVTDDGPGIDPAHVARLTERFYRIDKGRSRRAGGTGLGLAIVKHIVNRHRGQLVIESKLGVGSTFAVWLPQGLER